MYVLVEVPGDGWEERSKAKYFQEIILIFQDSMDTKIYTEKS